MTPRGIGKDDDVVCFEPELGDEVIVPGNGVNQRSGERIGGGEGGGGGESVFEREQAVHGFGLLQHSHDYWSRDAIWVGGFHDICSSVEVVEDGFVGLSSSARRNCCLRRIVPVPWHTDGLDVGRLGPFLDAPRDEFWLWCAPDACGDFGFGYGLEVRPGLDWPGSNAEGCLELGMGKGWMRTHLSRADETCCSIEVRRARLYGQEAFWRAERKTRRTTHPGSLTSSVATVESRHRTLRGG